MRTNPLCDTKPFEQWQNMPPVMQAVLPNVTWDRARLHELVLPVVEKRVDELRWMLDLPWWRVGERRFAVTPNQVRYAPERFAPHWRRMLDADLDYPIDLLQRDRLIILDGVHRLLKADVLGMRMLATRVLDAAQFAEITTRS
ncbi:MAG TPA: hypothetical protein VIV40_24330 [Kofleriaceae bacterium]